jgi:hypothetical protein
LQQDRPTAPRRPSEPASRIAQHPRKLRTSGRRCVGTAR